MRIHEIVHSSPEISALSGKITSVILGQVSKIPSALSRTIQELKETVNSLHQDFGWRLIWDMT